jgi:hypothetical protein
VNLVHFQHGRAIERARLTGDIEESLCLDRLLLAWVQSIPGRFLHVVSILVSVTSYAFRVNDSKDLVVPDWLEHWDPRTIRAMMWMAWHKGSLSAYDGPRGDTIDS